MPIVIHCPKCKAKLTAPDAAAGRAFTCPGCKTKVQFPTAKAAKATAPTKKTPIVAAKKKKQEEEVIEDLDVVEDEEVVEADVDDGVVSDAEIEVVSDAEIEVVSDAEVEVATLSPLEVAMLEVRVRSKKRGCDLLDPDTEEVLGVAEEVRDAKKKSTSIEIRTTDDEVLGKVRPAKKQEDMIEILDAEGELIGSFGLVKWKAMKQDPLSVFDADDVEVLELKRGKEGRLTSEAGELLSVSAREGEDVRWFAFGDGWFVKFPKGGKKNKKTATERLLLLAVGLGVELFNE